MVAVSVALLNLLELGTLDTLCLIYQGPLGELIKLHLMKWVP